MLEIQDEIKIEHEGMTFVFNNVDYFDLIEVLDKAKADNSMVGYYKFGLENIKEVHGIKHGDCEVTADDLKTRKLKLPFSVWQEVCFKLQAAILGTDKKDEGQAEKND